MLNLLILFILILFIPMLIFAPWVPTAKKDIERIKKIIPIKDAGIIYDLGSGDGKVLFGLSQFTPCTLIGIESFLPLYIFSIIKKSLYFKDKKIQFKLGNFFSYNLADANIIYVFGMEGKMDKLAKKLENECKKGTYVLSYAFPFPTWKELKKDKPTGKELSIYVYQIK